MTILLLVTRVFSFVQFSTICQLASDTFNLLIYATCRHLLDDVHVELKLGERGRQQDSLGGDH